MLRHQSIAFPKLLRFSSWSSFSSTSTHFRQHFPFVGKRCAKRSRPKEAPISNSQCQSVRTSDSGQEKAREGSKRSEVALLFTQDMHVQACVFRRSANAR